MHSFTAPYVRSINVKALQEAKSMLPLLWAMRH